MHIPAEMLHGAVCPVTATLAIAGIGTAAITLVRHPKAAPKAADMALTGATVFGLQMLNYPIYNGISGHLIGGVFAAALLGVPGGVLCTALVLLAQTLLFADGGLGMLGANIVNMSLIGAGLGGLLLQVLRRRGVAEPLAVAGAAFASTLAAVVALGGELLACRAAPLAAIGSLLALHAVLACVEGAITPVLTAVIKPTSVGVLGRRGLTVLGGITLAALLCAPLASAFPDAFEWTMARFSLLPDAPNFAHAPLADYTVPAVSSELFSTWAAGLAGMLAVATLCWFVPRMLTKAR